MIATNLQQPTHPTVTVDTAPEEAMSAEPIAAANTVVHDDVCAIHDEYGTCTCGAASASRETSDDD